MDEQKFYCENICPEIDVTQSAREKMSHSPGVVVQRLLWAHSGVTELPPSQTLFGRQTPAFKEHFNQMGLILGCHQVTH